MEGSGEGWDDGEIDRKVGRTENLAGVYHPVYILCRIILRHCLLQTKGSTLTQDVSNMRIKLDWELRKPYQIFVSTYYKICTSSLY
ncbi:hypothetical protein AMELA_G00081620 [Ameiurus melas]|uniref:Uncharacterized protein n=1 Tax=Ameiurus melas TaxID=219545 RepID=A0A7J6AZY9_AMEME|nr:hypothetical protein AMELA_G00081620 [Ameiurus melas]